MVWKRNVGIGLITVPFVASIISFFFMMQSFVGVLSGKSGQGMFVSGMTFLAIFLVTCVAYPVGALLIARNSVAFSIAKILKQAWTVFKGRPGIWIALLCVPFAISLVFSVLNVFLIDANGQPFNVFVYYGVQILSFVISLLLSFGLRRITILAARSMAYSFEDLFKEYGRVWKWFIGAFGLGMLVLFGLILFIFPGVYLAYRYMFVDYLLAEKNMKIGDAFRQSVAMTKGIKVDLFGFTLVTMVLSFAGIMVLGLGMIIISPVLAIASGILYVTVSERV